MIHAIHKRIEHLSNKHIARYSGGVLKAFHKRKERKEGDAIQWPHTVGQKKINLINFQGHGT